VGLPAPSAHERSSSGDGDSDAGTRACTISVVGLVTNPSAPHLVLSGEVDLSIAPSLRDSGAEMAKAIAPGRLEIDLGDVTFIDSSGLGALISLRNTTQQCGARLVLVRVSPVVARFFELAGVRDSFEVE
jgi:anti-anti-sigma factor